jgi:hypothetical protein
MSRLNTIGIVKKSLLVTLGGLAVFGGYIPPVLAGNYAFNRYIGSIYVGDASVYKNTANGVSATANINLPTCGTTSKLKGYITFNYKDSDSGYFNNYRYNVDGQEGHTNVVAYVNVPHTMSGNGNLYIADNTWCENVGETRAAEVVAPIKNASDRITKGAKKIWDVLK